MASYLFASPGFLKKNPEANGTVTFAIIIDRNVVPSVGVTFTAANSARVAITVSPETIPDFVDKSVLDATRMLSVLTPVPFILENIQVCGPDLHKNAGALQNNAFRAWERSQAGMRTGQQMHNVLARSQTYLDKVGGSNWPVGGPCGQSSGCPRGRPRSQSSGRPRGRPRWQSSGRPRIECSHTGRSECRKRTCTAAIDNWRGRARFRFGKHQKHPELSQLHCHNSW